MPRLNGQRTEERNYTDKARNPASVHNRFGNKTLQDVVSLSRKEEKFPTIRVFFQASIIRI